MRNLKHSGLSKAHYLFKVVSLNVRTDSQTGLLRGTVKTNCMDQRQTDEGKGRTPGARKT